MRSSRVLAFGFVSLFLLSTVGAAQEEIAFFGEGVLFYVAHGRPGSAHLALGMAYDGTPSIPYEGCGWVIGRPEKESGQVHSIGFLDGMSQLEFNFENFTLDRPGTQHGMARNVTIDGGLDHNDAVQFPKVFAAIAGWGQANLFVDGAPYPDPSGPTGKAQILDYQASFLITPTGFRDNQTGAIRAKGGSIWSPGSGAAMIKDNYEMQLRIESPKPGHGVPYVTVYKPISDLPDGTIVQQLEHQALYKVEDKRFMGIAKMEVTATSQAPDSAGNVLNFRVVSPAQKVVANVTVHPYLNHDDVGTVQWPLTMFQNYTIEATGKIALTKYQVTVTQEPPQKLDFNLWWEDLVFGKQAVAENNDCEERMGGDAFVTPGLSDRPKPPSFPLELTILSVIATTVAILFAVKLISDQWAGSNFFNTFKKR